MAEGEKGPGDAHRPDRVEGRSPLAFPEMERWRAGSGAGAGAAGGLRTRAKGPGQKEGRESQRAEARSARFTITLT